MQLRGFQGKAQRLCSFYTPLDLDKLIYEAFNEIIYIYNYNCFV